MSILEILSELNREGVRLVTNGERLGITPRERVSPELADEIRHYKPALLEFLQTGEIVLPPTASIADVRLALDLVNPGLGDATND